MSSYECWLAERDMNVRVRERLAGAESGRLVRQMKERSQQNLAWQLRWAMCGLGLRLVAIGARIEAQFLPPAKSAGRRVQ